MPAAGFWGIEFVLGSLIGFFVSLLGWQTNFVCIHRGLAHGKRSAFFTGICAALGDISVMTIVFSGTLSLVQHQELQGVIKWVGVFTLLAISLKILLTKPKSSGPSELKKKYDAKGNLLGFLVVVSNPGVYLLWAGVWSFLLSRFKELRDWASFSAFIASFLLGATLWFLVLSGFFLGHIEQWQESKLRLLSKVIAGLMLTAAVILIFRKT